MSRYPGLMIAGVRSQWLGEVSKCRQLAQVGCHGRGRATPLCPGTSDVYLLGYRESVVDLKLNCPQVASAAIDQRRLGSAE
jgi:hypothetical protein